MRGGDASGVDGECLRNTRASYIETSAIDVITARPVGFPSSGLQGLPSRDAGGRPSWPGLGRSHRPLRRPLGRRVRRGADPARGARSRDIRDFRVTCGIREVRVWPTIQGVLAPARERARVPSRRPRQPSLACRASVLRLQASTLRRLIRERASGAEIARFPSGPGRAPESLPEGRPCPAPRGACQPTQTDPFRASAIVSTSPCRPSPAKRELTEDARWRLFLSTAPGSSNFHHELGL